MKLRNYELQDYELRDFEGPSVFCKFFSCLIPNFDNTVIS
jgi:hypothetical protein